MKFYKFSMVVLVLFVVHTSGAVLAMGKSETADKKTTIKGQESTVVEIGKPAPDFTLMSADGKKHSLNNYKGKYVVLEWVNFDCPFVKKHYHSNNMQTIQANFTKKDVVWLSICSSAPGKQGYYDGKVLIKRFSSEKSNASTYLIDADGTVGKMYEAKTTPHMFIIDPNGILRYVGGIDDKASTKQADIKGATNYVVEALTECIGGKEISNPITPPYGCSVKYKK